MPAAKEQIRQIIADNNLHSAADVYTLLRDSFKDILQELMEAELDAQIQRCVIHMLRNSFKYVNYSDLKQFSSDFKSVYNAPSETAALSELEKVREKWGKKYPYAISSWENNWEDVSSFFQFSDDIRRIMYTTNSCMISSAHVYSPSGDACHKVYMPNSVRSFSNRACSFSFTVFDRSYMQ